MLLNTHNFTLSYPLIMGICNVTRDSFSDGGKNYKIVDAIKNIKKMNHWGASIIDIGAESNRPGSDPISYNQEIRKIGPILKKYLKKNLSYQLIRIKLKHKNLLFHKELILLTMFLAEVRIYFY